MISCGQARDELALEVDDPQLEAKLLPTLRRLFDEADKDRDGTRYAAVIQPRSSRGAAEAEKVSQAPSSLLR